MEIFNYAISGTGNDQQYLAYQVHAAVDHDLLVIAPYVENIRRISKSLLKSRDVTGEELYRSKPYYELVDGELALRNVPVPKQAWTEETLPDELRPHVYVYGEEYRVLRKPTRAASLVRKLIPPGPLRDATKAVFTSFKKPQPLPEYDSPNSPDWLLYRTLLRTWIEASPTPRAAGSAPARDGAAQPERSEQLPGPVPGAGGRHRVPRLRPAARPPRAVGGAATGLWSDEYAHFSVEGHEAIARSLTPVLRGIVDERRRSGRVGIRDL